MGEVICGFPGAEDCYDTGSSNAIKHIRQLNGCTDEYVQWGSYPECKQYTCREAFPVVFCTAVGGHSVGGELFNPGGWNLWSTLPPVP
jgi:hypothetical protein